MKSINLPWNPWRVVIEQLPHINLVMLLSDFDLGWSFARKIGSEFGDDATFCFHENDVTVRYEGVTFYMERAQVRTLLSHIDTLACQALVGIDHELATGKIGRVEARRETALLRGNLLNERQFVPWSLSEPIGIDL